jgi:hypothetical protein
MAVLSKDEARRERARKHASRSEQCECGRTVYGNGGKVSHYRRCRVYLEKYGWPFNEAEQTVVRQAAREATAHLPTAVRAVAWLRVYREACIEEARRRGLIT